MLLFVETLDIPTQSCLKKLSSFSSSENNFFKEIAHI